MLQQAVFETKPRSFRKETIQFLVPQPNQTESKKAKQEVWL